MAATAIHITVVVPIFNRAEQLRRLLAALTRQSFPAGRFEVIVVDDASSDEPAGIVGACSTDGVMQVLCIRQDVRGGPGSARNLGLSRARGEIVAFTDSDCEPGPGWLAAICRSFEDGTVDLLGGKVEFRGADHISGRCVNFLMSSMLGAAGARDPRALVHMKFYPRTCNLAIRRSVATTVGGFSGHSHGEDLEFSHRVCSTGKPASFCADAVIVHNEKRRLPEIAREAACKGAARVRLAKTRRLHEFIHACPAMLVLYVVALATATGLAPASAAWAALPLYCYLSLMVVLSIQGAAKMGELLALPLLPVYAIAMHASYGCGYIGAVLKGTGARVLSAAYHLVDATQIRRPSGAPQLIPMRAAGGQLRETRPIASGEIDRK